MTVKDPLEGAEEERAGEEEWEGVLEEEGWAAPDRAPAPQGIAYVPNAALLLPIKPGYPATSNSAPHAARPWSENSNTHMAAQQSKI